MRQIGTLPNKSEAQIFQDYLLTKGMKTAIEEDGEDWAVWIYDEDHREEAREELAGFRRDPAAERYRTATKQADEIRHEVKKKEQQSRKNFVDMRRRWERSAATGAPVTFVLIAISLIVAAAASDWSDIWRLCDRYEPVVKALSIVPYEIQGNMIAWNGLEAILSGQIWRLVTPIFLHFSILHILFNLLWLRELGAAVETRRGSLRFSLFVLATAAASNLGQYLFSGPMFGGMSGVVYGLFGYVWMKSRFEPQLGLFLSPNIVFWMVAWFVICVAGVIPNVANTAHGVGLLMGIVVGYAPKLWRDIGGR